VPYGSRARQGAFAVVSRSGRLHSRRPNKARDGREHGNRRGYTPPSLWSFSTQWAPGRRSRTQAEREGRRCSFVKQHELTLDLSNSFLIARSQNVKLAAAVVASETGTVCGLVVTHTVGVIEQQCLSSIDWWP
jgi:hypothetical protein